MINSGKEQRYSAIHIHVSTLLQTPLPPRLPHNIEQSSICYTVGPCWLSILKTAVWTCRSQTPFPHSSSHPQQPRVQFSKSVSKDSFEHLVPGHAARERGTCLHPQLHCFQSDLELCHPSHHRNSECRVITEECRGDRGEASSPRGLTAGCPGPQTLPTPGEEGSSTTGLTAFQDGGGPHSCSSPGSPEKCP